LSYAFSFLLLFVPLVLFHELGHFIVAKLAGIRVTKFAFGFGRELFSFHFRGTDYKWNLIPLGGYVDLMGEVSITGEIPEDPLHFYNRPKWIRFLVMVMGPLFNIILAFLIFWFLQTQPKLKPNFLTNPLTVGYVNEKSDEYEAGMRPGDQIMTVNDTEYHSFDELFKELALSPGTTVQMDLMRDNEPLSIEYQLGITDKDGVGDIQFDPAFYMTVGMVQEGSPAEQAGLKEGDKIELAEGKKVFFSIQTNMLSDVIKSLNGQPVHLKLLRDNESISREITPKLNEEGNYLIGIGISYDSIKENPDWKEAYHAAWDDVVGNSTLVFKVVKKLIVGELSVKVMTGPIGIGKVAKEQLDRGFIAFLQLLAILSLQLGIFNLIPIPMLDGGEIFVLLIEGVTRREFSLNTKVQIKIAGFFFLISLIILVVISDVLKLFT